jgi:hypothetical protein
MNAVEYVSKRTSELRVGDIVNCHGMRCEIDRELQVSLVHPADERGSVRWTQALVLNRDDEATNAVPRSWTRDWARNAKPNGEHRWTIQGNDLASWCVEAGGAI